MVGKAKPNNARGLGFANDFITQTLCESTLRFYFMAN